MEVFSYAFKKDSQAPGEESPERETFISGGHKETSSILADRWLHNI